MLADCRTPAPKGLSVSSSMGTPSRSVHDDEEEEEPEEADHVDGNLEEPTSQGKHRSRATSDASKRSKGGSPPHRSPSKENSVFDRLMSAGMTTRAKLEQKRHDAKGANDRETGTLLINAKSQALARDEPIEDRLQRRDKEYKAHLDELRRQREKEELKAYQQLDRDRRALEYTIYDKELKRAREQIDELEVKKSEEANKVGL